MPNSRRSARVDDRKIMNAIFSHRHGLGETCRSASAATQLIIGPTAGPRRGIRKEMFDQVAARTRGGWYVIGSTIAKAPATTQDLDIGRQVQRGPEAAAPSVNSVTPFFFRSLTL
jgi:hypothetical protein